MADLPKPSAAPPRRKYVRAVGPRLHWVLNVVWGLLAILGVNSVYLAAVTFLEWLDRAKGVSYQNYFYQIQFLAHLILGLLFVIPFLVFNWIHIQNTWNRPNRKAVWVGYGLLLISLVLLTSGLVLMRVEGLEWLQVRGTKARTAAYRERPSSALEERVKDRPGFLMTPNQIGVRGGVPIFYKGECVGGFGVSGVGEFDEPVAKAGAESLEA